MLPQFFSTGRTNSRTKENWKENISPPVDQDTVVEKKRYEWLEEALIELRECSDEAEEEGIEVPSEIAFEKAKGVIECLAEFEEEQPHISPMEGRDGVNGGEIVIALRYTEREKNVSMVVESDGSGVLFFKVDQKQEYKRIADAEDLPNTLKRIRISAGTGGRVETV